MLNGPSHPCRLDIQIRAKLLASRGNLAYSACISGNLVPGLSVNKLGIQTKACNILIAELGDRYFT